MVTIDSRYLINDVKSFHYAYDPEKDCWLGENYRSNSVRQMGTLIKITLTKKGNIKAKVKHYEAPPRPRHTDDYDFVDETKIKFKDDEFIKKLKSLKSLKSD
jgi:hypothetical protein